MLTAEPSIPLLPISHKTVDHHNSYLDSKEALLDSIEDDITAKVQPVLEATLEKIVDLPDDATEERTAALTPLNDTLQSAIGETLFLRQSEIAQLAVRFYPGKPAPMQSPTEFLNGIEMSGTSLAEWFRRRSPSRWMRDILKASPAEIRHTTSTAIDTAVWRAAALAEEFSWENTPLLMWINRPELSATGTCGVCTPLDGRKEKRRADFGVPYPAHPHCKCGIVPVNS